jgi:hypothetical protein
MAVELGGKQHLRSERLGEIDRSPEAELPSLTFDLVQSDELDIPRPRVRVRFREDLPESEPAPAHSSCGLRTPGQLAG